MLGHFMLPQRKNVLLAVEQDCARAGRALIQGEDILCHGGLLPPVSADFVPLSYPVWEGVVNIRDKGRKFVATKGKI